MSDRIVQAIVLAGGLGTRLRPVIKDIPKVLAPVGGRPFLHYILAKLHLAGLDRVCLATGYMGDQVVEECRNHRWDFSLQVAEEESPKGTGGAIVGAWTQLPSAPTLVLNGDSYVDWKLSEFADAHRKRGAAASVLLTKVIGRDRFGSVETDDEGRILAFREKKKGRRGVVNAGAYIFEPEVLQSIPDPKEQKVSLEREVLPKWTGDRLFGFTVKSTLVDIGTPSSFAKAQIEFLDRGLSLMSALHNAPGPRGLALLDRDGTIIEEKHHLQDPDEVEVMPGAARAVYRLCRLGYLPVVVTNQSVVGRGKLSREGLEKVHREMIRQLAAKGGSVAAIYSCTHHPEDGCDCRKPASGLVDRALEDFKVSAENCIMIGDKLSDLRAAARRGIEALGVRTGYGDREFSGEAGPDRDVAEDLAAAVDRIEAAIG